MSKIIWTPEMRKELYRRMLSSVGAHNTWTGSRSPLDKKEKFKATLRELAEQFSKETGEIIKPSAVEQQLDWGITVQKEMKNQGHVRTFILNKAAAWEVGFITTADLPSYMAVRK